MSVAPKQLDRTGWDAAAVRADFPVLSRQVHGRSLVYFDTAATAQRPLAVIEACDEFYRRYNANIHRGVHQLSNEATDAYEQARQTLADHVGAASAREIVFTRGTTEAINLVAQAWARPQLEPGDEILISHMEHHSNIVPWQLLCEQTGARLKVVPVSDSGELDLEALRSMLNDRVRLLGVVHVSNALGTINPVEEICRMASESGVPVLVDGAQALPHLQVDVQSLGCTFYCLSGHKMYGPTGIGALWASEEMLASMPPWQGGGEMIEKVSFEGTRYAPAPAKFEAGTPNIVGAIGLGAAVEYLQSRGLQAIQAHEARLLAHATGVLSDVSGLRIIGQARNKASVVSFTLEGVHPHDLGTIVDHHGFAIRTGHHCTMPLMQRFEVPATARVSLGMYNTLDEIDRFVPALEQARSMLS